MRILLINPNTSEFVTNRAVDAARKVASRDTTIEGVTGKFGAPIINSETDIAIGAHSTVDLASTHSTGFDGIGLAISFDTGLAALREMHSVPVAGMAESSIRHALTLGKKIALVSFAKRTQPLYERLVLQHMNQDNLAGVRCMEQLSMNRINDPDYLQYRIALEVAKTTRALDCDVIILLATAFAGLTDEVQHKVPVIDPVTTMIDELESSVTDNRISRLLTDETYPENKSMLGVSEDLAKFYQNLPLG